MLQNLAHKARRTTPYHLLAEAVEELHVRPILKARLPRGAERALANVELVLEMARAYAGRGIGDFARALWQRWEDGDAQTEGRPDAEADAVSIITIHSAKGLEWPIVIPINSTTLLWSDMSFLYRRRDDSVHFRVFDFPSLDYEAVGQEETEALRRERVRLWYVALTRARDLLLLPKQNERIGTDWLSLINLDINTLPLFDGARFRGLAPQPVSSSGNAQDVPTWEREAAAIAAAQRSISWHQPSRHEGSFVPIETPDEVFVGAEAILESLPAAAEKTMIQGGRERGLVLHKLMEEVLTGELADDVATLQARGSELLTQLGIDDAEDAATGPSSREMASVAQRTLELPEIAELRPKLLPEFRVYAAAVVDQTASLTAGIADAVVIEAGRVEAVIDWKSDVNPTAADIEMYRGQVRDYLKATGAGLGLIVFLTSGRVQRVQSAD
ncbi:MAG: 3'-5' exonuclease [Candidatus Binatus sp.]|uniref:3'-5' exonuclease n=1 Tax=Candidatus Binatus sp. TaxID=2811406 RepID=UPI00271F3774|nr:3'-5' exonuclease [Candidatus Binatus sp.]MDO8434051.1 3'-5' exonuclease [Candidatus Binatus sp.]